MDPKINYWLDGEKCEVFNDFRKKQWASLPMPTGEIFNDLEKQWASLPMPTSEIFNDLEKQWASKKEEGGGTNLLRI